MGWKYNIQYNTSCYGNHVFLYNTNKCAFEKKNPVVFRGSQSTIYHPSEDVFWCLVELIGTRPYNNGVLL